MFNIGLNIGFQYAVQYGVQYCVQYWAQYWVQYWGSILSSISGSIFGFNIGFNIGFQYRVQYCVRCYCHLTVTDCNAYARADFPARLSPLFVYTLCTVQSSCARFPSRRFWTILAHSGLPFQKV